MRFIRFSGSYAKDRLETVVGGLDPSPDGVLDYINGKWQILNPTNAMENFADRWADKPELAKAFFAWVYQLSRDVEGFSKSHNVHDLKLALRGFLDDVDRADSVLIKSLDGRGVGNTEDLLNLIHKGIEGNADWSEIKRLAHKNVVQETNLENKAVAFINYYQIKLHSGSALTQDDVLHVRQILIQHSSTPAFVLCCNLLLGTATSTMLKDTIISRYSGGDILSWPILRIPGNQITENSRVMLPY